MKTIKIEEYEFMYPDNIEGLKLHCIRRSRIIATYISKDDMLTLVSFYLNGEASMFFENDEYFDLKPKDDKHLYRDILPIKSGKYCCWVHEHGGYYAYCHKDGRLITRTGYSHRTWSSIGEAMLRANGI